MRYRRIPNPTRGCGHLKEGGTYLMGCEFSNEGTLPAIVEFVSPIPTLEGHFRGFEYVNGLQFLMVHDIEETFREIGYNMRLVQNNLKALDLDADMKEYLGGFSTEYDRARARAIHAKGKMRVSNMNFQGCNTMPHIHSLDLLMYVGESYYKTPDDFIDECYNHGFSKRISVLPNCIWPGHTRVFFAHMRAIPDRDNPEDPKKATPGVFGYAYLSRAVYIKKRKGKVPEKIIDLHKTGKLEIVVAEDVPEPEDDNNTLEDFQEDE